MKTAIVEGKKYRVIVEGYDRFFETEFVTVVAENGERRTALRDEAGWGWPKPITLKEYGRKRPA